MKRHFATLILAALIAPTVLMLAGRAVRSNHNDASDWLPTNYPETQQLRWFRSFFVSDQFLVISWDGCTVGNDASGAEDDPRISRLEHALGLARWITPEHPEGIACFKSITSGRRLLTELTAAPISMSYKQAVERLQGLVLGPDGKQTCVVVTLVDSATKHLRDVVGRPSQRKIALRRLRVSPLFQAIRAAGLDENKIHLGGPPIDNVSIDEEGEKTLLQLAGFSGLLGIGLAWWSLRSFRMTVVVFGCGILSAALALACVPLTGSSMDAITMSMPALVYVLAVSGAIHYLNYYKQALAETGLENATARATREAWKPALLCAVTTAIGLASLCSSDITPIAKFGGYSAAGVLLTMIVLFGLLPATLALWPWIPVALRNESGSGIDTHHSATGKWHWLSMTIQRHHWKVATACLLVIGCLSLGLPRVTTSIDLLKLFSSKARLLQDYRWFEAHLGKLVPVELVIRIPASAQFEQLKGQASPEQVVQSYSLLERLELVSMVQRAIADELGPRGLDLIGASMSAATFATTPENDTGSMTQLPGRYIADQQLQIQKEKLLATGYLRMDETTGEELWRISVRVAAFHNLDHGQLIQHFREAVEPVMQAERTSERTLLALAQKTHATPAGARVLIWAPQGSGKYDQYLTRLLGDKRVWATSLHGAVEDVNSKNQRQLQKFAAIVPGTGFEEADFRLAQKLELPVLNSPSFNSATESTQAGLDVVYTGVIPIVYKAQRALLDSLIQSSWWSFASITPLMMFVSRSVRGGLLVMLPNVLPILVVFGGMGWLGLRVDIGSMMAASIALGVSVDDTIHFLAWFRDDLRRLGDRDAAVLSAYERSATPTLQAALVNGLGLSVFAISSFTPTQRFGWLMLAILFSGVAAELIMLPALLFSRLGNVLVPKQQKANNDKDCSQRESEAESTPADQILSVVPVPEFPTRETRRLHFDQPHRPHVKFPGRKDPASSVLLIVEAPLGQRHRYGVDGSSGRVRLVECCDPKLNCPGELGFLPDTVGNDGRALDAVALISKPTFPGCQLEARILAALRIRAGQIVVSKILAAAELDERLGTINDLSDIPSKTLRDVERFFARKLAGPINFSWVSKLEAIQEVDDARKRKLNSLGVSARDLKKK